MTTVAWFHCFAGIAGDMALGSLLDAGADVDAVCEILGRLPIGGWKLDAQPVLRGGIAATRAVVLTDEGDVVRTYSHIAAMLDTAPLPDRVRDRAHRIFRVLAEVEGRLHRRPTEQVHFHEVGGLDAIVDVVGVCAALELLGIDDVYASPIATGSGMVRSAHGMLPNPAPAVVELLRGAPVVGHDIPFELTTPTGAAIVAALAAGFGALPPMRVTASGFGAGTRELDSLPNATQIVIGTALDTEGDDGGGQPVVVLETNVDDVTGEVIGHTIESVLAAGALDAWTTAVTGKKGRPALVVSVLCDHAAVARLRDVLAAETGSFGVRATTLERWPQARSFDTVVVFGASVRVKRSGHRVKAEFDDAARVAHDIGRPVREVIAAAEAEASVPQQFGQGGYNKRDDPGA
jgi:uncharacterized protein (TIGR00299 family) protein